MCIRDSLVGVLEVLGDLESDFGLHFRGLALLYGQLVEEVLGLSEHQVGEHGQGLVREVRCALVGLQLGDVLLEILEDPSGLLHMLACLGYSLLLGQIHVAGDSRMAHTIVELRTESVEDAGVGSCLGLVEAVKPHPLGVDLVLRVSETEVLVEQHRVVVRFGVQIKVLVELLDITLVGGSVN